MLLDKRFPFSLAAIVMCAAVSVLAGCREDVAIRSYSVSTRLPEEFSGSDRMLGAIVQDGETAWFFKMSGPTDLVEEVGDPFREWIGSLQFVAGTPEWTLPQGWTENPGSGMRTATIVAPVGDSSVEASVSKLPGSDDWDALVVDNVNRWRRQLGEEPSEDVLSEVERIELANHSSDAYVVDITGTKTQGGRMMHPGQMVPPMQSAPPAAQTTAASASPPSELEYDVPDSWREGTKGMLRLASFVAGPDEKQVEITVIPAGGDVEGNVRRWLGQIRAEVPETLVAEAIDEAEEVVRPGDASDGKLYVLDGDNEQAIYAVIFPDPSGINLFVKMTGHSETAAAQRDAFVAFAESIRERT